MPLRLFDCFTFFNEATMLEFRLRYLSEVVDVFVIAESRFTFTGSAKPITAHQVIERLPSEIRSKVRFLEVKEAPTGHFHPSCNWEREAYQRNALCRGLYDLTPDDLMLISDVDEIPHAARLEALKRQLKPDVGALNLCMHMFYYRADNQMYAGEMPVQWLFPKLVRPSHLLSPQSTRLATQHFGSTSPCGWHLSYMGSTEQISHKIRSFSHQEYNNAETLDNLSDRRGRNQDPFGRGHTFRPYPEDQLPHLLKADATFRSFFLGEQHQETSAI
jgi:beta-1,4-mannosyl-glycoprotein beta-1,4-N-acetylglucosaminyltransferase